MYSIFKLEFLMKLILIPIILFIVYGCSLIPREPYKVITEDAAKSSWDKTIAEFEKICLATKGTRANTKVAPPGKRFFYRCQYKVYRGTDETAEYSDHPLFGYHSYVEKGNSASYKQTQYSFRSYLRKQKGFEKVIWGRNPIYASAFASYMLKNGYTLFTIGEQGWTPLYKEKTHFVIRAEGFSEGEYPTLGEIYGTKRDIPITQLSQTINEFKNYVMDEERRSESAQMAHKNRLESQWARDRARKRRQKKASERAFHNSMMGFSNSMMNNKQDQQFFKAYNNVPTKPYRKPKAGNYTRPMKSSNKTNSHSYKSNTRQKKKVDVSRIACVKPYANPVPGAHGFYILRGGSVVAGGPYCEHFSPRKGVRDCSGHKRRHAEDFKLRGKKHCEKLRNGMTYVSTSFTQCNCAMNDAGQFQCRIAYKHSCK